MKWQPLVGFRSVNHEKHYNCKWERQIPERKRVPRTKSSCCENERCEMKSKGLEHRARIHSAGEGASSGKGKIRGELVCIILVKENHIIGLWELELKKKKNRGSE